MDIMFVVSLVWKLEMAKTKLSYVYASIREKQSYLWGNNLFSFLSKPIEHPVRTNQIPRQIPEQSFFTKPLPGIIMGGILPFGCIFIQLFFILNSIWWVIVFVVVAVLILNTRLSLNIPNWQIWRINQFLQTSVEFPESAYLFPFWKIVKLVLLNWQLQSMKFESHILVLPLWLWTVQTWFHDAEVRWSPICCVTILWCMKLIWSSSFSYENQVKNLGLPVLQNRLHPRWKSTPLLSLVKTSSRRCMEN